MGEVNQDKCDMIAGYFKQYGWDNVVAGDETGTWQTKIQSEAAEHGLFVRVTEWWIYFVINPFCFGPKKPELREKLYYHLLRLNLDISVAKYSLNADDNIVLSVELPCDSSATFQYDEFADGVNLIFNNCNNHYLEIMKLCIEADAPSKYINPGGVDIS